VRARLRQRDARWLNALYVASRVRFWFYLGCLLAISWSTGARARDTGLHWVRAIGAEQCIDPTSLAERVEALTGPVFSSPTQAKRFLEGLIEPHEGGYRVRLTLAGPDRAQNQERVLSSVRPDCRSLDATVVFVVALTLDPSLFQGETAAEALATFAQENPPEETLLAELEAAAALAPPTASPSEASALAADERPPPATTPAPSARPADGVHTESGRPPWHPRVALQATVLFGTLPEPLPGVVGLVGFSALEWLDSSAQFRAFFGTSPIDVRGGQQAELQALEAALSACPGTRKLARRLRLFACVGITGSHLRARGLGFDRSRRAQLWDATLTFGAAVNIALYRGLGLLLHASTRLRLSTGGFESTRGDGSRAVVLEPARWGGMVSLGPSYEF
jgi:hypothetical protein